MPQHSSSNSGHNERNESAQLAAALGYIARGWRVFPLHSPTKSGGCTCGRAECSNIGKHPRTPHGVKDASGAAPVLEVWWGQQWRRANIGLATGSRSGLVVLDVDPRHGGDASLCQLQAQYDILPETLRVATGGGGEHWYFQHPNNGMVLNNRAQVAGLPGLDARGDGGYVVAPPSWHASGARYDWIDPTAPVASLPTWLLDLLMKQPISITTLSDHPPRYGDEDTAGQYWLERALAQAQEGTRNVTGFWLACQLRDEGLAQGAAESYMTDYASRVPGHDYTIREALNSLRQAFSGVARDRARSATTSAATVALPRIATRKEWSYPEHDDDGDAGGTSDDASTGEQEQEARRRARFTLLSDEEVEMLPPPVWQISNLLVADSLSVVYGEFGSAKSFLVLDWALSIATGTPWMGKTVAQGPVVYIAGEGIGGMGKRIKAWKQHHNWQGGPTGLWLLGTPPLLLHGEDVALLRQTIREIPTPPVMIVIDTLARSMTGGDENSAQDMGMAVAAAESLRAEFGCHILLVHHKPAGASKTRGSTALPGAADTLIDVTKDGDHIVISCEKQKDAAPFERIHAKLLTLLIDENTLDTSCVLTTTANQSMTPARLPGSAENVLTLLQEQPDQKARFADLLRGMTERFGMSKTSLQNALHVLEKTGHIRNDGSYWRIAARLQGQIGQK